MFITPLDILAQEKQASVYNCDTLITVAKELMETIAYCA